MHKMKKEIFEQTDCLKKCYDNNIRLIKTVVENIKNNDIHSIIFVARGSSDNAATFGKYAIEILSGIPVSLAAPSVVSIYKKNLKLEKTCVIGVSQSGQSEDICQFMEMAGKKGAITVAITNNLESRLAQNSQFSIDMSVGKEEAVAATKSFTAEVLILEMLAAFLSDDYEIIKKLPIIDKIVKKALDYEQYIKDEVYRFRYLDECFVLGRGLAYPIALEFALKVQETSYIRAKGFSSSDFMHGPIAMINNNIPVFIIAFSDETAESSVEIAKKLYENDIDVIAFSDIERLKDNSALFFEINSELDIWQKPFFVIPMIQLFSYYLSILKKNNPDKPRLLNKVTITK